MAATNESTFDLDPPHRPAISELGGAAKENNPKRPPDPVKHPTAEEWNHFAKLLAKLGATMYLARLYVKFSGGTPSIQNVMSPRGDILVSDFIVVDVGAGDTKISWKTG